MIFKDILLVLFQNTFVKFFLFILLLMYLLSDSTHLIINYFRSYKFEITKEYVQKNDFNKLIDTKGWLKTIKYAKEKTDRDATFLLFRDAEFPLYVKRKFITYLDPILLDAYKSENENDLYLRLKDLNISYIYTPPYPTAVLSNSMFSTFISNPNYTALVSDNQGYRLFKINKNIKINKYDFCKQSIDKSKVLTGIYQKFKEYQTRLYSPTIDVSTNSILQIEAHFTAIGTIDMWAYETGADGIEFAGIKLETFKNDENKKVNKKVLYFPSIKAKKTKFVYIPSGKISSIHLEKIKIYEMKKDDINAQVQSYVFKMKLKKESNVYLSKMKVAHNKNYYINSNIQGSGILYLYVIEYNKEGKSIGNKYLNSIFSENEIKKLNAIYLPSKDADFFKLFYRKKIGLDISILNHTVYEIKNKEKKNVK